MELYRAVPRKGFDPTDAHFKIVDTVRIPSNVPYIVDNIWEWLRPADMPSRRHAVFASATPELALANASAGDGDYVVCRVVFDNEDVRIAQIIAKDARYHSDIKKISRIVSNHSRIITEAQLNDKRDIALLFLPGLSRSSLDALQACVKPVNDICIQAATQSTFWQDASHNIEQHPGEIFFELVDPNGYYMLEPV